MPRERMDAASVKAYGGTRVQALGATRADGYLYGTSIEVDAMPQSNTPSNGDKGRPSLDRSASSDGPEATAEALTPEFPKTGVSQEGGFANDPDDPSNPNESIERHRRKLRR